LSFQTAHPGLQSTLARRLYTEPTTVQAAVLAAAEGDLLVSAQTGSGKTVAFGMLLARPLLGEAPRFTAAGAPLALVVTPTRELAMQVHRELAWLYADTGARITTCVGGMDPRRERHELDRGVHIVVGTPGRLCDHLDRKSLVLAQLKAVVLDEADEMLDMGFREDIERLLDASPPTRRTLMFSATIPKEIATLAKRYQKQALRIAASTETERHLDIEYQAMPIVPRERDLAVVNLLRFHEAAGALVFCATRDGVTHLAANLNERGFAVVALSGELSQRERNLALQALRDGRARVCVATDVAARGLDLPDLGLVIHADLPQNKQMLVHRSGRTGRAGKRGIAIVLVPDNARRYVERTLQSAHVIATWLAVPSADDIYGRDQALLAKEIGAMADETTDEDRQVARALLGERSAEEMVASLVRLRRQARPAPEELTVPPSMRPRPTHNERPQQQRPNRPTHERANNRAAHEPQGRSNDQHPRPSHDQHPARSHEQREMGRSSHDPRPTRPAHDRPRENHRAPAGDPLAAAHAPHAHERVHDHAAPVGPEGGAVWFTINVGRSKNADPKWLIPLLCRRGNITKREIGKIQILARETRVEIAPNVSDRFAEAVRQPDPKDRNIHIEPLDAAVQG
jgi:ATP-dependent RNA helicase DeaD